VLDIARILKKIYCKLIGKGKMRVKWILGKSGGKAWTGCVWPRIGTSGGFL
jgi:hypothetical protein